MSKNKQKEVASTTPIEKATLCQNDLTGKLYHSLDDGSSLKAKASIKKRRDDIPAKYCKLYDRVTTDSASPRDAIRMNCLECNGWVIAEVRKCNNYACPLFRHRPYQGTSKLAETVILSDCNSKTNQEGGTTYVSV